MPFISYQLQKQVKKVGHFSEEFLYKTEKKKKKSMLLSLTSGK